MFPDYWVIYVLAIIGFIIGAYIGYSDGQGILSILFYGILMAFATPIGIFIIFIILSLIYSIIINNTGASGSDLSGIYLFIIKLVIAIGLMIGEVILIGKTLSDSNFKEMWTPILWGLAIGHALIGGSAFLLVNRVQTIPPQLVIVTSIFIPTSLWYLSLILFGAETARENDSVIINPGQFNLWGLCTLLGGIWVLSLTLM